MSYNDIFDHVWTRMSTAVSLVDVAKSDSWRGNIADKHLRSGIIEFDSGNPHKESLGQSTMGCNETQYNFKIRISARSKSLKEAKARVRLLVDLVQDSLDSEDGNYGTMDVVRTTVRFTNPKMQTHTTGETKHGFDTAVIEFKTYCKVYEVPGSRA